MDSILKLLAEGFESTWANKDFLALLGILIMNIKLNNQLKLHQVSNDGQFGMQNIKIKNIDEKVAEAKKESSEAKEISKESKDESKKALEISNKALNCATKMGKRVSEIGESLEELFLSGKFEDKKHGQENIRSKKKNTSSS